MKLLYCPRLKPTVQMNEIGNKLYLRASGMITELEDHNGSIKKLIGLLDGEKNISALYELIIESFPDVRLEEIYDVIHTLDDLYLLEDGRINYKDRLTQYDVERWHRNINFFGSFCKLDEDKYRYQEKLKNVKVTLLGLGGLGSHILFDLVAMGVHNIRAFEFDNVEISNLNRQILYTENDVGQSKAEAAKARILQFNSQLNIEICPQKINSTADAFYAVDGSDIVICVADRPKMEILDWVNGACVKAKIPLISGGLDTRVARYFSVIPGETGCIACWRKEVALNDAFSDRLLTEQRRAQLQGDNAAFVTFVSVLTGAMLAEFVKIVTGIKPPVASGKVMEIPFDTMLFGQGEAWSKHEDCHICGTSFKPLIGAV